MANFNIDGFTGRIFLFLKEFTTSGGTNTVSLEDARLVDNRFFGQIDMTTNKILNVGTPTFSGDAANKFYVDEQIASISIGLEEARQVDNTFLGDVEYQADIYMNNNNIFELANPTLSGDATNKYYVDNQVYVFTTIMS